MNSLEWALTQSNMTCVFVRSGSHHRKTETQRKNVLWWQKQRLEWCSCKPKNTLILDFQPLDYERTNFWWFLKATQFVECYYDSPRKWIQNISCHLIYYIFYIVFVFIVCFPNAVMQAPGRIEPFWLCSTLLWPLLGSTQSDFCLKIDWS